MPVGPMRSRLRCWAIQAQVAREWTRALSRPRRGLCQSMSSSAAWRRRLAWRRRRRSLRCALGPFGVHEQAEAVLEAERSEFGIAELALDGLGEGRQAQGRQFVDGGVSKHGASSRV
jgi:hypothetical protein